MQATGFPVRAGVYIEIAAVVSFALPWPRLLDLVSCMHLAEVVKQCRGKNLFLSTDV